MNQGSLCLRNSSFCTFGFSGSSYDMEDKKHSLKRHAKKSFACSYDDLKVKHNKQSLGFEILKNQKESLWTVQCKSETTAESSRHEEEREVESYPKVRQRKKRSRTKSSHNEEVKDNTYNSSHSPNSEDNPFLQMLSDELEALKSPKTKYFHPSKHEKNIKSKHATGTAGHNAVKPINKYINGQIGDLENEGSAELEERCESELEEGELLEDPTETSRSSHSSKRKSHKGKRALIQTVSGKDFKLKVEHDVDLPIESEIKSEFVDQTIETEHSSTFHGEGVTVSATSFFQCKEECDSDWSEKMDASLTRDLVDMCRPLTLEEGEISSAASDSSSSRALVLSCDEDIKAEEMRLSKLSYTEDTDPICINTDKLKQESETPVSNGDGVGIVGSVLGNMLHGLYSQDARYHPTDTVTSDEQADRTSSSLSGCSFSTMSLPSQCSDQGSYLRQQQPQGLPPFLMQYQQQWFTNMSQTMSSNVYQSPVRTLIQHMQWGTMNQASIGSLFSTGAVGPPPCVGQLSHTSPLYCPQQNYYHTSNWTQHMSTGQQPGRSRNVVQEMSSKLRQWDIVKSCRRRRSGGMEFTVMTYNILSQDYLEQNQDLYRNCDSCDLDWTNRGPALLKEIISHNADIVCLQEVQQDHWERDLMEPLVKHGYQFAYKQKSGLKPDGCAILFKKDKFKKLELVPVDFRKGGLLDRDNVGLILLLQPTPKSTRVTAPKICVATTHLLFNPKRGDVKLAQMMLFLAEIDKYAYLDRDVDSHPDSASSLASSRSLGMPQQTSAPKKVSAESHHASKPKPTYCPVILCGDLNTEPFCAMYKFITTGYIKYEKYTSKQFCGQKEGHGSGGSSLIGKELLLESLDITQSCQYTPVVNQRFTYPPERRMLRNSGRAFHDLYFKSVYGHSGKDKYGNKLKEITTQHERVAATLDYIFYSTGMKNIDDSQATNLPLELLARYKLLTTGDMQEIGYLPNKMFPSDHFCLIARFLLK
ncbi:protein angel 2 isoform X2 [Biomphalaria pfeifferi]|uniref:Protein angel 2 isoform X2 n=1 Tax=Biomphalaria pfeifferi TaxID=112525 RepID=A0AAD8AQK4_BIOPF|nr:protein angel 2 isoform X2 [Biomphalaria pfeifferi]